MITPSTCRAGRGLLGLTQAELAAAAGVGLSTLRGFENGTVTPIANNRAAIQGALEQRGIEFLGDGDEAPAGGAGVRFRKDR